MQPKFRLETERTFQSQSLPTSFHTSRYRCLFWESGGLTQRLWQFLETIVWVGLGLLGVLAFSKDAVGDALQEAGVAFEGADIPPTDLVGVSVDVVVAEACQAGVVTLTSLRVRFKMI
jgi:hypothetical protein